MVEAEESPPATSKEEGQLLTLLLAQIRKAFIKGYTPASKLAKMDLGLSLIHI